MSVAVVLGFDYSTSRIGIAVGQALTATASPLESVAGDHTGGPDWDTIAALISTWKPETLVVGLPLKEDGGEQENSRRARRFRNQLEGRFGLPTHMMDERFSTLEARSRLASAGKQGADDNPLAATIILESWFAEA